MSDTEPINLPARVVRAMFRSDLLRERAQHYKRKAFDEAIIGVLFLSICVSRIGQPVLAAFFAVGVAMQVYALWRSLHRRKKAQRESDALFQLTYEYAVHRTLKPWPKEDA